MASTVIDQCMWPVWEKHAWYEIPFICFFSLVQDIEDPTELIFLSCVLCFKLFETHIDLDFVSTSPATLEHLNFNIGFRGSNDNFNCYRNYVTLMSGVPRYNDNYGQCERVESVVLKSILGGLPLLSTKGILFVEAENEVRLAELRLST